MHNTTEDEDKCIECDSTTHLGTCDVCKAAICQDCALNHSEYHASHPFTTAANGLERVAQIATGLATMSRGFERALESGLNLMGARLGRYKRRRK